MTVQELVDKLSELDPDTELVSTEYFWCDEVDYFRPVDGVRLKPTAPGSFYIELELASS